MIYATFTFLFINNFYVCCPYTCAENIVARTLKSCIFISITFIVAAAAEQQRNIEKKYPDEINENVQKTER